MEARLSLMSHEISLSIYLSAKTLIHGACACEEAQDRILQIIIVIIYCANRPAETRHAQVQMWTWNFSITRRVVIVAPHLRRSIF